MFHHQCSNLTGQSVEQNDVTLAYFIEHRDHISLSESGSVSCFDGVNIRQITLFPYVIVIDIIADVLNQAIVSHRDITQSGIPNA